MKRVEAQSVGQIIREMVQSQGMADNFNQQRLNSLWPEVVGPGINRYTSRRYVIRGVLHVFLTSAPLKQELQFQKQRLIQALNQATGEGQVITDIKFH